jgi:hypothetical protein
LLWGVFFVNKTSTDKITSATPFLIWFRRCLPARLQVRIRPFLDQPYQLALTVLDCCNPAQPLTVGDIAAAARVSKETARQVLQALKEGGMNFAVTPTRSWQPLEGAKTVDLDAMTEERVLLSVASAPVACKT